MGGWGIGEGVGWEGERIRWGSGIPGRFTPACPVLLKEAKNTPNESPQAKGIDAPQAAGIYAGGAGGSPRE
jgi:hypothetical protein